MGFSVSDLESAIGKNGIEDMKSIAIDKGTAFLSNQVTSAFVKTLKNEAISSSSKLAVAGIGAYGIGKDVINNPGKYENTVKELSEKIILKTTEKISQEATKLVMEYTQNHLKEIQSLPSSISSYAMAKFNEEKMSVGDVIKILTENADEESKKHTEEQEKNAQKNFISSSKEKISEISENVTKYSKEITKKINMVTEYMQEGPDWVVDQLNKQCQSASDYIQTLIDEQWKKDQKVYKDFEKSQGDAIGSRMAGEFNEQLMRAQKTLLDKQSIKTSSALTKAKTKILGAALSAAAKTGLL